MRYIIQTNPASKGLPYILLLLIVLLFGSIVFVSCEDPNGIDTPEETNTINGFEYVDLGLSVKWAACNVGAYAPDDYGNYYAWGETGFKTEYTRENSVTYNTEIDNIGGNSTYDVATLRYGTPWRLPTKTEINELIANCDYQWDTVNGIVGGRFTSRINGNSIYLPAAGIRFNNILLSIRYGFYWSSDPAGLEYANILGSNSKRAVRTIELRAVGCSVRPVAK